MTKVINSFSEISDKYNVFILDQWGVMHNGHYGFDHAIAVSYTHLRAHET